MEKELLGHEYFMKQALSEAKKAFEEDEIPVGAVIVANNLIIARAYNRTESLNDVTAHAEMQVITAASEYLGSKYLNECILYVTLEPCAMCAGALYWARLGKIVYGAADPKKGYRTYSSQLLHPRTEVVSGILENESETMLLDFFRKKRNLMK